MLHKRCEAGDIVDKPPPTGPIDLDALNDYLMSDLAPNESMGLSAQDSPHFSNRSKNVCEERLLVQHL